MKLSLALSFSILALHSASALSQDMPEMVAPENGPKTSSVGKLRYFWETEKSGAKCNRSSATSGWVNFALWFVDWAVVDNDDCRSRLGHFFARDNSQGSRGACWDFSASQQRIVPVEDSYCKSQDDSNGYIIFTPTVESRLEGIVTQRADGQFQQFTPEFQEGPIYKTVGELEKLRNVIFVSWDATGRCAQFSWNWSFIGYPPTNRFCAGTQGLTAGINLEEKDRKPVCRYYTPPMKGIAKPHGVLINTKQFEHQLHDIGAEDIAITAPGCEALIQSYLDYAKVRDNSIASDEEAKKLLAAQKNEAEAQLARDVEILEATLKAKDEGELEALRTILIAKRAEAREKANQARARARAAEENIASLESQISQVTSELERIRQIQKPSQDVLASLEALARTQARLKSDKAAQVASRTVLDANATELEALAKVAEEAVKTSLEAAQKSRSALAAQVVKAHRAQLQAKFEREQNERARTEDAHRSASRVTRRENLEARVPVSLYGATAQPQAAQPAAPPAAAAPAPRKRIP